MRHTSRARAALSLWLAGATLLGALVLAGCGGSKPRAAATATAAPSPAQRVRSAYLAYLDARARGDDVGACARMADRMRSSAIRDARLMQADKLPNAPATPVTDCPGAIDVENSQTRKGSWAALRKLAQTAPVSIAGVRATLKTPQGDGVSLIQARGAWLIDQP
jgi:hypothetical protein